MLKNKHLIQWGNGFNMRTLQQRPSARSCLISFIFLFVTIFKIMNSQECKSVNRIPGYRLVNHVLETVNLVSFVRCTVLCTDHPDCYSINHFTTANTCELNNKTKFWSLGDFLRSDNTFYMDMLVRQYDPCVVEKPCQSNGRCIPYHNNGTFRCECSKRYTGKTCDHPRKDRNVNCSGHILDLCQLQMTAWKATILGPSSVNLSGCNPDDVQNTTELLLFVSHSRTDALEDYGKYQIVRINDNVGCTVTLLTPIKLALSGTPCEVIAQRLPYFDQVSLTKSCQVTCGGAIGSILALRAVKLTIDSTSKIEVNGKGYRGGAGGNSSGGGGYGGETFVCLSPTYGKGGDRGQSGDAGGGAGEVSTVGPGGFNAGGGGGDSRTNEDDGAGGGGGGGHYSGGGGGGGATGCLSQNSGNGGNASSVINAYAGGGGSSNCPGKNGSNGGTSGGNAGNSVRGGKGGSSPSSVYGGGGGGGGLQYGNADFQTRLSYGGGGGGGGGSEFGFAGGRGGNGGGLVLLLLDQLTLNGTIEAKGSLGKCSPVNTNYRGAAGGSGAGGSVVIFTKELFGVPNGKIFVQGGTPPFCAFYTSGGGGGGIGRWVVKTSSTLYTSG